MKLSVIGTFGIAETVTVYDTIANYSYDSQR